MTKLDVIPFLILSMARSGTQLLSSLLRAHPHIVTHGEVLNPFDEGLTDSEIIVRAFGPPADPATIAAGVTLLRGQLGCRPLTLSTLLSIPSMRVIVLERRNQLERLRSEYQAEEAWRWECDTQPSEPLPTVQLSPVDTMRSLQEATIFYSQLRYQVFNLRKWVYYEDLIGDQDAVLEPLWPFLGVGSPGPISASTFRQESRPLCDTVANLDEIREHLAGTDYAYLLAPEEEMDEDG